MEKIRIIKMLFLVTLMLTIAPTAFAYPPDAMGSIDWANVSAIPTLKWSVNSDNYPNGWQGFPLDILVAPDGNYKTYWSADSRAKWDEETQTKIWLGDDPADWLDRVEMTVIFPGPITVYRFLLWDVRGWYPYLPATVRVEALYDGEFVEVYHWDLSWAENTNLQSKTIQKWYPEYPEDSGYLVFSDQFRFIFEGVEPKYGQVVDPTCPLNFMLQDLYISGDISTVFVALEDEIERLEDLATANLEDLNLPPGIIKVILKNQGFATHEFKNQ